MYNLAPCRVDDHPNLEDSTKSWAVLKKSLPYIKWQVGFPTYGQNYNNCWIGYVSPWLMTTTTGAFAMGSSSYMEGEFPIQPRLKTASPSLQASAFQALEGSWSMIFNMIQIDSTTKLLVSNCVETIHPWKLTWNPKMEVDGRWFSFSIGLLLGSSRSFSRVHNEMETIPFFFVLSGYCINVFFFECGRFGVPTPTRRPLHPEFILIMMSIVIISALQIYNYIHIVQYKPSSSSYSSRYDLWWFISFI